METEVPRRKEDERKEEKSVVQKERATDVGLPSTINKAAATGSNDKGIEPVATEILEESEPLGAFLVDVSKLLVLIKKNPDVDHHIYGEIYVPTRYRNVMLFKRGIENPQKVGSYGGRLMLEGPLYPLKGYDRLTFMVDLWEDGEQVLEGFIDWFGMYSKQQMKLLNSWQYLDLIENKALLKVQMVAYSNAILANVEFKLRKRSKKNHTRTYNIHGRIFASNSQSPDVKILLFDKYDDESIQVGHGDVIPLMRSMIAVPLNTSLKFGVHLTLLSAFFLCCEFMACKDYGVDIKSMSGKYGKIEVAVTWESLWGHSLRTGKLNSEFDYELESELDSD
ncbi:uncharacterized protein LOC144554637 [Carex rostrata]